MPPLPVAPTARLGPSARRAAGRAPGELRSCPLATVGRPGELILRVAGGEGGGGGRWLLSGLPGATERRPRMPERRLEPAREHQLADMPRRFRRLPGGVSGQLSGGAILRSSAVGALLGPRGASGRMPSLRAARTVGISRSKV